MNYKQYFFSGRKINYDYDVYLYYLRIIPNKAKVKSLVRKIEVPTYYIIDKIRVCTINDKICLVYLDVPHPNSDLISFKYCLPESLINEKLDINALHFLKETIKLYNLNSCYFQPYDISFKSIIGKETFLSANLL